MQKKKSTTTKKSLSTSRKVSIGIGLTGAAVAAAGAYFLYGSPNAKKNRRKVKSWMFNAKAEVLGALERAENMTETEYNHLIETVGKTYSKLKDATNADVAHFKKEMKEHWPKIVKEGKTLTKTVANVIKKTAKPARLLARRARAITQTGAGGKTSRKFGKKAAKKSTKKISKKSTKKTSRPARARRAGGKTSKRR